MHSSSHTRHVSRAFTLVEVMISVAIVLILIVGISQVFKISSDSAGTNFALGAMARDHRAAQATMSEDFRNCVPDSPFFLIDSEVAYQGSTGPMDTLNGVPTKRGFNAGWKNVTEQSLASNPDPAAIEINGTTSFVPIASTNDRIPRIDRTAWFARSVYQRGTASDNAQISTMTSSEAFIWYGHTCYPTTQNPTLSSAPFTTWLLPENQYAVDRILGRVSILLKDSKSMSSADQATSYPNGGANPPPNGLDPIDAHNAGANILNSRFDAAQTSIAAYGQLLDARVNTTTPPPWWLRITDSSDWAFRFTCNPKFSRPITASAMATAAPYFVGHCTQFIVEYAGDYLNQKEDGTVTDVSQRVDPNTPNKIVTGTTDGKIDFIYNVDTKQRRIRWYGLYRDVDNDGVIGINDVVPLADVLQYYNIVPSTAPWEKVLPSLSKPVGSNQMLQPTNNAGAFKYICAWHNDAPPMIRILIKLNDPGNRLQDGQWYEYVLTR